MKCRRKGSFFGPLVSPACHLNDVIFNDVIFNDVIFNDVVSNGVISLSERRIV